jgi:hypothetical protein
MTPAWPIIVAGKLLLHHRLPSFGPRGCPPSPFLAMLVIKQRTRLTNHYQLGVSCDILSEIRVLVSSLNSENKRPDQRWLSLIGPNPNHGGTDG